MVAELSGSMVIVSIAIASAFLVGVAILDMADSFDSNTITNVSINVWDRFGASNMVWVEVVMTYPGGPLEISGDINMCFVPESGTNCTITNKAAIKQCSDPSLQNTKHNCWGIKTVGSANQLRYEGALDIGFDVQRHDPLGYVVSSSLHDKSGTVGVR